MKKTYITPNIDIYKVKAGNLLAGSPGLQGGSAGTGTPSGPINFARQNDTEDDW